MNFQTMMIDATKKAAEEAFRYAKAVPADKIGWSPLESGRSVLDQCRELAMCPTWAYDIIDGKEHEWNDEIAAAIKKEGEQWTTVEACEAECNRRLESLFKQFASLPDEKLSQTRWLPYDGGRDFTFAEMMEYPRWNFTYHLGQIAYIQTLLGDKDMH